MKRSFSLCLCLCLLAGILFTAVSVPVLAVNEYTAAVWSPVTIELTSGKTYSNPYTDVDIDATFRHSDGTTITLPGFWYHDNTWAVRFSPTKTGVWSYTVTCTDTSNQGLHNITGTVTGVPNYTLTDTAKHGFVRIADDRRHFSYTDGTPFFWLGDTNWQAPATNSTTKCNYPGCSCGGQFQHIVNDRSTKGFTVYQTYFSATSTGSVQGNTSYWAQNGGKKVNTTTWNERIDFEFSYIHAKGMVAAIGFGCSKGTAETFSREVMTRLARYIVARYACYNVVWISGQEITSTAIAWGTDQSQGEVTVMDVYMDISEEVERLDGYKHPNSAHMYPMVSADGRAQRLADSGWHDFWLLQSGHGASQRPKRFYQSYFYNEYVDDPSKAVRPYIEGEANYEEINCGGFTGYNAPRYSAWKALLNGAAGFTYGASGVWAASFSTAGLTGWYGGDKTYSYEPWYLGVDKPGSWEVVYMKRFFEKLPDRFDLKPVFYDDSYSSMVRYEERSLAYTDDASTVAGYFYNQNSVTGTLNKLDPTQRYTAYWYDPLTGAYIEIGKDIVCSDGTYTIPPKPTPTDWAFLMTSKAMSGLRMEAPYQTNMAEVKLQGSRLTPVSFRGNGGVYYDAAQNMTDPTSRLIDNDPNTVWEPVADRVTQTFWFDFGQAYDLTNLYILPKAGTVLPHYRVYASNDNASWYIILDSELNRIQNRIDGAYVENLLGGFRYVKVLLLEAEPLLGQNTEEIETYYNPYTDTTVSHTAIAEIAVYGSGRSQTPGFVAPREGVKPQEQLNEIPYDEETGVFTLDFENRSDLYFIKEIGDGRPFYAENIPGASGKGCVRKNGGTSHFDTIGLSRDATQLVIDGKPGYYTLSFKICFEKLPNGICEYCTTHDQNGKEIPAETSLNLNARYYKVNSITGDSAMGLMRIADVSSFSEKEWYSFTVHFYIDEAVAHSPEITLAFDMIGTNSVFFLDDIVFGPYGSVSAGETDTGDTVIYTVSKEMAGPYLITRPGLFSPEDATDRQIAVSYDIFNDTDHPLKVALALQTVAENPETGKTMWAGPPQGKTVTIEPHRWSTVCYSTMLNEKNEIPVYNGSAGIKKYFARLNFGSTLQAGDSFAVRCGSGAADAFMNFSTAEKSAWTAELTTVNGYLLDGDVNVDSVISADDVTALARHLASVQRMTGQLPRWNADMDHNGDVNAADLTLLARSAARI